MSNEVNKKMGKNMLFFLQNREVYVKLKLPE